MSILLSVLVLLFILFFFGLCIFVHEFGHLLAALWRGLFVERFSIGFFNKIWGFKRGDVEYIVSAVPFGGYVAIPQLEPTEEPTTSDGRPLPPARPLNRIITAAAGPLFNVLFGFFLALFVWWIGVYRPAPARYCDVITVPEKSPEHEAGLRVDDRVWAVNGQSFSHGWSDLAEMIVLTPGTVNLDITRDGEKQTIQYRPAPNPETEGLGYPFFRVRTPTVVHQVAPNSPAAAGGLSAGDVILKVNGGPVESASGFIDAIRASDGKPLSLLVERNGSFVTLPDLHPRREKDKNSEVFRIGAVIDAPVILVHTTPWDQFVNVIVRTSDTLRSLFTKGSLVKARHMSGPIGIAQVIGMKVYYGGFRDGLAFIVFISFSLAFFNLLPIPVLDGGHILWALIELVSRRPVPIRVARATQFAFASLLITFMLYVTFFDVKRVGVFWHRFTKDDKPTAQPAKAPPPPPAELKAVPEPAAPTP